MQIPEIPVDMRVKVQPNLGIPYFRHGPRLHAIAILFPVPTELGQVSSKQILSLKMSENFGSAKPHAKNTILLNFRSVMVWYGDSISTFDVSILFVFCFLTRFTRHKMFGAASVISVAFDTLSFTCHLLPFFYECLQLRALQSPKATQTNYQILHCMCHVYAAKIMLTAIMLDCRDQLFT